MFTKVNELNAKYQKVYNNNQDNLKIISYKEKSKELTQRRINMLEEQLVNRYIFILYISNDKNFIFYFIKFIS